jgi:hypothetical protein
VASASIQPETVEALVQNVRGLITDEEQHASSLISRGSGLAGFVGIILALAGVAARSTNGLGGVLGRIVVGLSAAAFVSLALAVVVVVVGLLVPRSGRVVSAAEISLYRTTDLMAEDRVSVQAVFLRGLVRSLEDDRRRNQRGSAALRVAYALVCLGLVFVTAVGVTLTLTGGLND